MLGKGLVPRDCSSAPAGTSLFPVFILFCWTVCSDLRCTEPPNRFQCAGLGLMLVLGPADLYGHLIKTPFKLPVIGVSGFVKEGIVPRATSSARIVWLGRALVPRPTSHPSKCD